MRFLQSRNSRKKDGNQSYASGRQFAPKLTVIAVTLKSGVIARHRRYGRRISQKKKHAPTQVYTHSRGGHALPVPWKAKFRDRIAYVSPFPPIREFCGSYNISWVRTMPPVRQTPWRRNRIVFRDPLLITSGPGRFCAIHVLHDPLERRNFRKCRTFRARKRRRIHFFIRRRLFRCREVRQRIPQFSANNYYCRGKILTFQNISFNFNIKR